MIGQKNHATIYAIRELVCKQFDVVFEDFTDTKKRTKQIVDARIVFIYLCLKLTDIKLISMCKIMNIKFEQSIWHMNQRAALNYHSFRSIRKHIEAIEETLNSNPVLL